MKKMLKDKDVSSVPSHHQDQEAVDLQPEQGVLQDLVILCRGRTTGAGCQRRVHKILNYADKYANCTA